MLLLRIDGAGAGQAGNGRGAGGFDQMKALFKIHDWTLGGRSIALRGCSESRAVSPRRARTDEQPEHSVPETKNRIAWRAFVVLPNDLPHKWAFARSNQTLPNQTIRLNHSQQQRRFSNIGIASASGGKVPDLFSCAARTSAIARRRFWKILLRKLDPVLAEQDSEGGNWPHSTCGGTPSVLMMMRGWLRWVTNGQ